MHYANDMKAEKKLVNVRMSEALAEDLRQTSEQLEMGQSQFIREAVRDRIATERQKTAEREQAATAEA